MKLSLFALSLLLAVLLTQGCSESRHHEGKTQTSSSLSSSYSSSEESSSSQGSSSSESNITIDPTIKSVKLSIPIKELPENNQTTVSVLVTSIDETNTTPKTGIVWHIGDTNIVEVNGTRLFARNEGHTTIQAEVRGVLSSARSIAVYRVVHGHRLPPEPDPKINNATLLGVDSNHNGVRDDVERWIYMTYDHPIERGLFMQSARAYQKVIVDPSKALETKIFIENAVNCESYWSMSSEKMESRNQTYTFGEYGSLENEIKPIQFNTLERHMSYKKFNAKLSGGVYSDSIQPDDWGKSCEFDKNGFFKVLP